MMGGVSGIGAGGVGASCIPTIPDLSINHPQRDSQLRVRTQRQKGGNGEFAVVRQFNDGQRYRLDSRQARL